MSMLPKQLMNEGTYRLELLAGLHLQQWLLEPGQSVPTIWLSLSGGLGKSRIGPLADPDFWRQSSAGSTQSESSPFEPGE